MEHLVAKRYSKALYTLLSSSGDSAVQIDILKKISSAIIADKNIHSFFSHPAISKKDKKNILEGTLTQLNATQEIKNFVSLMIEAGRIEAFDQIINQFEKIVNAVKGHEVAEVFSTIKIGADEMGDIRSMLEKLTAKKLEISNKIDPNLLGGILIKIGNNIIDLSIKNSLDNFEKLVLA